MEFLKKMGMTFFLNVAGVTLSATLFITIFARQWEFSVMFLWEIIVMATICTLGNLIFYSRREISKRQMRVRMLLHYLYINIIVFGGAIFMRWLNPASTLQILVMILLSVTVYIGVTMANISREKKTAEILNKRLRKLNASEEEKNE